VWFLIGETHRGQLLPPALTLPQVRSGLSQLLLEVYYTPGVDEICRQVQRQLMRNELARFYHHRTRRCIGFPGASEKFCTLGEPFWLLSSPQSLSLLGLVAPR